MRRRLALTERIPPSVESIKGRIRSENEEGQGGKRHDAGGGVCVGGRTTAVNIIWETPAAARYRGDLGLVKKRPPFASLRAALGNLLRDWKDKLALVVGQYRV